MVGEGCRERGREREPQADSALSRAPDTGLDLTTMRSRPEPKSRVGHFTNGATQEPPALIFLTCYGNKSPGDKKKRYRQPNQVFGWVVWECCSSVCGLAGDSLSLSLGTVSLFLSLSHTHTHRKSRKGVRWQVLGPGRIPQ